MEILIVCNLLLPALLIIVGALMGRFPPKKINALYGYRTRGDSIMNQRFHEGRFDELTAIDELCDFVRKNCPSVQRAADCRRFSCLCQTLLAIPPEDARYRGRAEAIFAELCRLRWRVLSDPRARMKNRGAAALTLLGERGFRRCAAARG